MVVPVGMECLGTAWALTADWMVPFVLLGADAMVECSVWDPNCRCPPGSLVENRIIVVAKWVAKLKRSNELEKNCVQMRSMLSSQMEEPPILIPLQI